MALVAAAENAQDIASVFHKFLEPVSEYSTEVTGLISECFAISSALHELAETIQDQRYSGRFINIREDVQITVRSLEYTFTDVHRLFGGLGRTTITISAGYRAVWRAIEDHFLLESRNTLCARLKFYRQFLQNLLDILTKGAPSDWSVFDDLQVRIDTLLEVQDARLEENFNNLSIGTPAAPRQRSFERRRPGGLQTRAFDVPDRRPRRQSPGRTLRQDVPEFVPRRRAPPNLDPEFVSPPHAPDAPSSPTTTSFSSHSSNASSPTTHWVSRLFEQSRPSTPFKTTGPVSACYGVDTPEASTALAEEYNKLLQMLFENGDLLVRLYVRSSDRRARIYCRIARANQSRKQCCVALTSLRVERVHSSLKFNRTGSNGRTLEFWACLRFPNYERLVLFFCTFLALKADDTENRQRSTEDYELHGEKLLYSGLIIDDHYEHGLRLFKDRDSGGIRLQASVLEGHLKRTPVWTAFITHQISSPRWMRRDGTKTIHLADLQRYIFTDEYTPQLGPGGEHELCFMNSNERKDFERVIDDVVDQIK